MFVSAHVPGLRLLHDIGVAISSLLQPRCKACLLFMACCIARAQPQERERAGTFVRAHMIRIDGVVALRDTVVDCIWTVEEEMQALAS
jgi:hypothetical protein